MTTRPPVSLAVVNARVWTGDARRPWADAVAVRGDRLAAVGPGAEARKLAGAGARVVDARGGTLVPGAVPPDEWPAWLAVLVSLAAGGDATPEHALRAMLARDGGTLRLGGAADFTLVDRDLARAAPGALAAARPLLVVRAGTVVHDATAA